MNALIAYASKGGTSKDYANAIAEVMTNKGLEPDVVDLTKGKVAPDKYDIVIAGFGVRAGRSYKEALEFLKSNFTEKKVAIFVSTMESEADATKKYITPLLSNQTLKPISTKIFGGRFKILWKTMDKFDAEKAKKWAIELCKKF